MKILTPATPYATAKLQSEIALLLKQLWADAIQRDSLDANVVGSCITMRIMLFVYARAIQRVVERNRRDDARRQANVADCCSCAGSHSNGGLANDPHGQL